MAKIDGMEFSPIPDGNSDFDSVEIRQTPHCIKHGAMLKVSEAGLWRCIRSEPDRTRYSTEECKKFDCRAGCIWRRENGNNKK